MNSYMCMNSYPGYLWIHSSGLKSMNSYPRWTKFSCIWIHMYPILVWYIKKWQLTEEVGRCVARQWRLWVPFWSLVQIPTRIHFFSNFHVTAIFAISTYRKPTFRLDESTTTTTLPSLVPWSTQPLHRNSTTLVKHNLSSSITTRYPHRQIGHGDIDKIISQPLVDLLTIRLQHLPTKSCLGRTSSSRCIVIFATNNQKKYPPHHDLVVCKN